MSTNIAITPGQSPLDIVHLYITARVKDRHETPLVATAHIVQVMTDDQARKVYDLLMDRPLTIGDADLAQLVAQRLGIELEWWHCDLVPGATWEKGRKQVE